MTCRSLILDLDGTLIDSRPGILESITVAANAVFPGFKFDPASIVLGPPIQQMFAISFPEGTEADREKLLLAFREHYDRAGHLKTELYDGVRDILSLCRKRGINLYIATNKPARISSAILGNFKIRESFRVLMAIDSVQPPFPGKTAILRHLLRENNLDTHTALYVGDSVEDAKAAGDCGVPFIWAAYGYGKMNASTPTPLGTIHAFGELRHFLE
jgi:phosphoglycolate phosphatase-like HAD superfamily hydrolase